jgi:hypothetical protein
LTRHTHFDHCDFKIQGRILREFTGVFEVPRFRFQQASHFLGQGLYRFVKTSE